MHGILRKVFDFVEDLKPAFNHLLEKIFLELTQFFLATVIDKEYHLFNFYHFFGDLSSSVDFADVVSQNGFPADWSVIILDLFLAIHPYLWKDDIETLNNLAIYLREVIVACFRYRLVGLKAAAFNSNLFVGLRYDLTEYNSLKSIAEPTIAIFTNPLFNHNKESRVYIAFIRMFIVDLTNSEELAYKASADSYDLIKLNQFKWAGLVVSSFLIGFWNKTKEPPLENVNHFSTKLINAFRTERFRYAYWNETVQKWSKILKYMAALEEY